MINYLTIIEIAAMHKDTIRRYGGMDGIRDKGALDAACYRPQCGYYNTVFEQASALMESLIMNHPFIDGNKRVAFAATYTFLYMNGHKFTARPIDMHKFMISAIEQQQFNIETIAPYLKDHSVPVSL